MDLNLVNRVATAAAYSGGEILNNFFGKITKIDKKGAIDLVTEADLKSEQKIIEKIRHVFPDHGILAEESGLSKGDQGYQWIIDPLDGTTNFAHQLPFYAISIAFAVEKKIVLGIVLNPRSGECFSATFGQGARLNGRPIRISPTKEINDSLLATGFPYDTNTIFQTVTARFSTCLKAARGVRRLGSAALDLCFVACGRFEAFWEQNLKPWDTAAGALIVTEAGGAVTTFGNQPYDIEQKEILATNAGIHDKMVALLAIEENA